MQEQTQYPAAETPRIAIWSVSARMLGLYLAIYGVICAAGIAAEIRSQLIKGSDDYIETALRVVKGAGSIGIGAASIALTIAIAWEGIMVLAQFVKRKQIAEGIQIGREQGIEIGVERGKEQGVKQGIEQGVAQGVAQGAKSAQQRHAKIMREWAAKRGIPADELPSFDAQADSEDAAG